MEPLDRKAHWERIYQTKALTEVSWFEPHPDTSLSFLRQFNVPRSAAIIDVGGGDSLLVDHLLDLGYQDVTVLDLSEAALERAKARLGKRASQVHWIIADAATFRPTRTYDFWHDRAAFHFLTNNAEADAYLRTIREFLSPEGVLVIGTFSEQGPTRCSGLEIKQYSETSMTQRLQRFFEKIRCLTVKHTTPFQTVQEFIFCSFRKVGMGLGA
jgi:SAM-dependent methyltransferase